MFRLLNERCLKLDRASVQWLEQYLIAQKNVTCLIVSHDSGYAYQVFYRPAVPYVYRCRFLDTVTTDIIHYETKKARTVLSMHVLIN